MTTVAETLELLVDLRDAAKNAYLKGGSWRPVEDADQDISNFMLNNVDEILNLLNDAK